MQNNSIEELSKLKDRIGEILLSVNDTDINNTRNNIEFNENNSIDVNLNYLNDIDDTIIKIEEKLKSEYKYTDEFLEETSEFLNSILNKIQIAECNIMKQKHIEISEEIEIKN